MIPLHHIPSCASGRTYWMLRHAAFLLLSGKKVGLVASSKMQGASLRTHLVAVLEQASTASSIYNNSLAPDINALMANVAIVNEPLADALASGADYPILVDHHVYETVIFQLSNDLETLVNYLKKHAPDTLAAYMRTRK